MFHTEKSTSLEELKSLPDIIVTPEKGYWEGQPHCSLVEVITKQLPLANHSCYLSPNGLRMAAKWTLVLEGRENSHWHPTIGIINDNMGEQRITLYGGMQTLDGIGIVFERYLLGKHTHKNNEKLFNDIATLLADWQDIDRRNYDHLMWKAECDAKAPITEQQMDKITVQIGDRKILPWSRIGIIHSLLAVEEIVTTGKGVSLKYRSVTELELRTAFGKANKLSPPFKQMKHLWAFQQLLQERTRR